MIAAEQTQPTSDASTSPLVEVRGLNRVFDSVHAVQDLSFAIRRGAVVGIRARTPNGDVEGNSAREWVSGSALGGCSSRIRSS